MILSCCAATTGKLLQIKQTPSLVSRATRVSAPIY
jgi:hypothetical protein